ncbi:MAG: type II toxin-antitoxin system MqsA family antitoxin [Desulfotignum sp.]|jgi:YgiT-type zinc finger domain-containing protein|nr:type II toxin-antitoxin system MqsA family antitoxin [Desulfotignum sp.]MCF8087523.1 type II toxin-antitoxin system MqsA family antitoxin [Desulfotignum sp.]MCF8138496.1 type II toxin-antitoxin system MqsA family antitoxin [Desulfotignum sp.]
MKCAICRNGITTDSFTTVLLEREQTTLVFKQVPAKICENCGEEYISSEVSQSLLSLAEQEYKRGVKIEMLDFAA